MDIQYDVVIIGAGPSGMSAAIYASRAGLKTLMLEANVPGGKLIKTYEIQNYPSIKEINGSDLANQMFEHSTTFGAEYKYGNVVEIIDGDVKQVKCDDGSIYTCKAVIIATGTKERLLNIPNEKELTGRGVSYCAVCDGAFFRNQTVVVIGGGNAALEESLYLTQFVKEVVIVIRRDVFRAEEKVQAQIENNEKIRIIQKHIPVEILGENNRVKGIVLENVDTKEKQTVECKAVFPYVGADPITDFAKGLNITDEKGYIKVNNKMETSVKGIYGAGDCIVKDLRQVVTACNDGAIAAQMAFHYIKG